MKYQLINLELYSDNRGSLISFEKGHNCPFDIKRCFYIFDTSGDDTIRGLHANKKSKFLLIALHGACKIKINTGKTSTIITLNSPKQALFIDSMVWKEMYDFSPNTVLMCLSNELYDENEYIRDYQNFELLITNNKDNK